MSSQEDRPNEHVLDLLHKAGSVPEWPDSRYTSVYERIDRTVQHANRSIFAAGAGRSVVLAVGAATAAVLIALLARPMLRRDANESLWRTVSLGDAGTLEVTSGTQLRLDELASPNADEQRVYVLLGPARATIAKRALEQPFVLVTPHLRVVVVGTRFSVDVTRDRTSVSLQDGLIRIESLAGGSAILSSGQSISSADPRLARPTTTEDRMAPIPSAGASAPPAQQIVCGDERSIPARRKCLEQAAGGDGLPAQNALYALGLLENEQGDHQAALDAWRRYERRFPRGLLAPEVSIAVLRTLLDDKQYAEALRQTESFGQSFADDARRAEIALIGAKLLCLRFGKLPEALAAFDQALVVTTQSAREDGLYSRAVCIDLLSGRAAAQNAWRAYLEEFPDGAHAQQARSRVAPVAAP